MLHYSYGQTPRAAIMAAAPASYRIAAGASDAAILAPILGDAPASGEYGKPVWRLAPGELATLCDRLAAIGDDAADMLRADILATVGIGED